MNPLEIYSVVDMAVVVEIVKHYGDFDSVCDVGDVRDLAEVGRNSLVLTDILDARNMCQRFDRPP